MPGRGFSLARALISGLEAQADQVLLTLVSSRPTGGEHGLTGTSLLDGTHRVSALVQDRGVRPGELVLLAFDHSSDLIFAFVGCLHAGAVPSIIPPFSGAANPEGWRGQVERLAGAARPAAILVDSLHRTILENPPWTPCPLIDVADAPQNASPEWRAGSGRHATYVQFSSGTTGPPTGIVLSHDNVQANLDAFARAVRFREGTRAVGWLPLHHDMGLVSQLLLPVTQGGRAVLISPSHWVRQPLSLLHAITEHQGETCMMPNFGFRHCAVAATGRDLDNIDLRSLRFLGNGSERIDPGAFDAFESAFESRGLNRACFHVGYGLAEFVLAVTVGSYPGANGIDWIRTQDALEGKASPIEPGDADSFAVVGCGKPVSGAELQIRDELDRILPDRRIGRVFVRGDSTAIGFWNGDAAFAERVKDGWLDTRDRGYMVGRELYLVDRADDMMIVGGQNLLPVYIEEIALSIAGPQAGRAAAFGVFDGSRGTQDVVLIVEIRGRHEAVEAESIARRIRQEVAARLGVGIADLRIVRRGWIEKTTSGKVSRARAKARYLAEFGRGSSQGIAANPFRVPPAGSELELRILALAVRALGLPGLGLDEDVFDAGADSIRVAAWLTTLHEGEGLAITDDTLARPLSIRRVAQCIVGAEGLKAEQGSRPDHADEHRSQTEPKPVAFDRRRSVCQRMVRSLLRFVGKRIPPRMGSAVTHILARWTPVSWILSPNEAAAYALACKVVLGEEPTAEFQRRVAASVLSRYWISSVLPRLSGSDRVVRFEGLGYMAQCLHSGTGVVIASTHGGEDGALRPMLESALGTRLFTVGLGRADREDGSLEADTIRRMTAQLLEAERRLTSGGVVAFAADGRRGRAFQSVPFLGRARRVGTGFAELAVKTGAVVVPMSSSVTPDGLLIRFGAPLTGADPGPAAVRALVAAYGGFLEQRWRTDLATVYPHHVAEFFGRGSAESNQEPRFRGSSR